MKITEENILSEAEIGNLEVLKHPSVDKIKDDEGWTPLHWLALNAEVGVLDHPSVDKVRNNEGATPLHELAGNGKVTKKWLKEKYPWFKFKKVMMVDTELIGEILSTPQSIKFILKE